MNDVRFNGGKSFLNSYWYSFYTRKQDLLSCSIIQDVALWDVCWGRRPHILLIWGHSSNLIRPAKGFLKLLNNYYQKLFFKKSTPSCLLFWPSEESFWPITASITSEVINDHALVTTQRILNKFIEVNFSVGCMVWPWCCLFQPLTTSKTIDKIVLFRNGIKLQV